MSYTITLNLLAGTSMTGLTDLRAQLVNSGGTNNGSPISTGFTELGGGNYQWTYAGMPDNFRGTAKFYSNADPSEILGSAAVNPGTEYLDIKLSTLPRLVWAYVRRTLTQAFVSTDEGAAAEIKIHAHTTAEFTVSGLSIAETWTKIYLAAKTKPDQDDGTEVLLIVVSNPDAGTDGLLILNGDDASAALASLTVDAEAGTIDVLIEDDAMNVIAPRRYCYDIKQLVSGRTTIIGEGDIIVQRPVNRRIS